MQRDEHRMGAHVELIRAIARLREADHLDAIAEFVGHLNVQVADLRDTLAEDLVHLDRLVKGE